MAMQQYASPRRYVYNTPVGHLTLLCSYRIEICDISWRQNKASINAYIPICLLNRICCILLPYPNPTPKRDIHPSAWLSTAKLINVFQLHNLFFTFFYQYFPPQYLSSNSTASLKQSMLQKTNTKKAPTLNVCSTQKKTQLTQQVTPLFIYNL